jgi:hypothetical protein
MKRLFSSIGIISIVSSVFAFSQSKAGAYCASITRNTACTIVYGKKETLGDKPHSIYFKYNAWNGTPADCWPNRCETETIFYNED